MVADPWGGSIVAAQYRRTDFAHQRALRAQVGAVARLLQSRQTAPNADPVDLDRFLDYDIWGHPLQYAWENGSAVVRAAGKDGKRNTGDDVTCVVPVLKKTKPTSNPH